MMPLVIQHTHTPYVLPCFQTRTFSLDVQQERFLFPLDVAHHLGGPRGQSWGPPSLGNSKKDRKGKIYKNGASLYLYLFYLFGGSVKYTILDQFD